MFLFFLSCRHWMFGPWEWHFTASSLEWWEFFFVVLKVSPEWISWSSIETKAFFSFTVSIYGWAYPQSASENQDSTCGVTWTVSSAPPIILCQSYTQNTDFSGHMLFKCDLICSCDSFCLNSAEISDDLKDLLLKMLDKNPETRISVPQIKVKTLFQ